MIVTRSWLSEWINLDGITTEDLCKTFNSIGLEVDSLTSYTIPKKIIFGTVLECEKHPDADKLNVCKVDIGTSIRQIVCGASNIRAGIDVVVATIGAVMPSGLAIKPVKLRGVDSEGMICSASEIGFVDCQSGILEVDSSMGTYELGQEVRENPLFNDDVIEIELTANRGDCLSIRGVARDLSAAYDRPLKEYTANESDNRKGIGRLLSLSHEKELNVELSYKVLELKNLSLPLVVKLRLVQIDETRETDIDSLLLYTTHSSGVILRAYDYKFFTNNDDNTSLAKVELCEDENAFASIKAEEKASVVGVMQTDISRVKEKDGRVLLEASYIPPDVISKQMALNKIPSCPVFYRTSRGSEPELSNGISCFLNILESSSDSSSFSGNINYGNVYKNTIISLTKDEVDEVIGADINQVVIGKILKNLGFDTSKSTTGNFVISVPRYRHDISNKQDIIEEIVRMIGIDNIPSRAFTFTEDNKLKDDYFEYKKRSIYRHKCANSGFFESIHFVFDEKKILEKYGFETIDSEMELLNPIVNTLDTLRTTLMTGLLKAASHNVKSGYSQVKLFEIGSIFNASREESLKLALLFSGDKEKENLLNAGKPSKIDFGTFSQKISDVIGDFELKEGKTSHMLSHMYQSANIIVNNEVIGELFRVHPEVEKAYALEDTYICEIDFEKIKIELKTAQKTSKYQASYRDLSVIMPKNMQFEKVKDVITDHSSEELIRFYPVDKYSDESLGDTMSLSIRFVLQSMEKTLEEEDITASMDRILQALKNELGIGLRE
ncbi:phenylalanine--tRNA ligase subunit beta [Sulfurimonas sp. SAG-AH-194-I05]|nr:phenylalanine--tRNA ligase subunit beta [Sulfurimonas sp. SAG-AH-194-I05]MDF1874714.1 phenylalanine--tRNA ligase subunit beta [Sulfurimonas sp. SAG-AH-194-I05]